MDRERRKVQHSDLRGRTNFLWILKRLMRDSFSRPYWFIHIEKSERIGLNRPSHLEVVNGTLTEKSGPIPSCSDSSIIINTQFSNSIRRGAYHSIRGDQTLIWGKSNAELSYSSGLNLSLPIDYWLQGNQGQTLLLGKGPIQVNLIPLYAAESLPPAIRLSYAAKYNPQSLIKGWTNDFRLLSVNRSTKIGGVGYFLAFPPPAPMPTRWHCCKAMTLTLISRIQMLGFRVSGLYDLARERVTPLWINGSRFEKIRYGKMGLARIHIPLREQCIWLGRTSASVYLRLLLNPPASETRNIAISICAYSSHPIIEYRQPSFSASLTHP